jgi:hypothetical protein
MESPLFERSVVAIHLSVELVPHVGWVAEIRYRLEGDHWGDRHPMTNVSSFTKPTCRFAVEALEYLLLGSDVPRVEGLD